MRSTHLVTWQREVTRTSLLQATTKVLLLDLYIDGLYDDGTVSLPRVEMARRLGVSARSIDSRITDAVGVGFLLPMVRGRKHTTAIYMISDPSLSAKDGVRAEIGGERRRRNAEKWRQIGAQREGYKGGEISDSAKDGVRAENGQTGTSDVSARRTGFAPVVTQATYEPAPTHGVPDPTPTATTRSILTANGTATAAGPEAAMALAAAQALCGRGQDWLRQQGLVETPTVDDLLTVDLGSAVGGGE